MSNLTLAHTTYHSFPGLSTKKTAISQRQTFGNFAKISHLKDYFYVLNTQFTISNSLHVILPYQDLIMDTDASYSPGSTLKKHI